MVTNPDTCAYVQAEIEAALEETGSFDIDYVECEKHTAKMAVLYETLRLHPSIPKNIRRAVVDDVLPNNGPRIEPGDILLYSDWAMGRNPDIWGKDAAEFRPSRWIEEDGSFMRVSQSKAHFFSVGPRACLGSKLATYEVCQVMNVIFGKYNIQLIDMGPRKSATFANVPDYLNSLTHPMKRPLMVRATKL